MDLRRLIPCFAGFALLAALLLGGNAAMACAPQDAHDACGSHAHGDGDSHSNASHIHADGRIHDSDHPHAGHTGHCNHLHCCACEGCHRLPELPVAIAPDTTSKDDLQLALSSDALEAILRNTADDLTPLWARPPPARGPSLQLQHLRTVVLLT